MGKEKQSESVRTPETGEKGLKSNAIGFVEALSSGSPRRRRRILWPP